MGACPVIVYSALFHRGCYFPSGPDGHLSPLYAISRLGPRAAASNCVRCHGGYTGWCATEHSRRGLVSEIISPLWLGRVSVRVVGRVIVRIRLGVGLGWVYRSAGAMTSVVDGVYGQNGDKSKR